jgi:transcriptional regulator with XRE-family HTH domain
MAKSISPNTSNERALLKKIGLKIHGRLFDRNMTVDDLADSSGLARSTLCEVIAGRSNPRLTTVERIANSLGFAGARELIRESES